MIPEAMSSSISNGAKRLPWYRSSRSIGAAFVLLWCTGYPAGKIALEHCAPFTLLVLRFGCAGLIYALLALAGGAAWPRGRDAIHSAVVGMLSLALQFGGVYLAVALGVNIGIAALVIGTMPILTGLLGSLLGQTIRPLQWLGFAIGFAGVALVVGDRVGAGSEGVGAGAYVAVVFGLIGISVGTLYQKRFGSAVDLRSGLTIQHLVATLLLLPLAGYEGFRCDGSLGFALSLGWLVAINSLAGFALFFVLLRRGAASEVAALFFLMPPVAALLDYFVLAEPMTWLKLLGFVVAAFGVYLGTRAPALASTAAS
jgi:drug/metabolite transporter (DMT)-like permease